MRLFSSLDDKDRKLLFWSLAIAVALAAVSGWLLPNENTNDNPVPSSYLAGQHGSLAAFETLERLGYRLERWERPLSELASSAGPDTVVIFAQPFTREHSDIKAVREIVERGGRVLATGFWGGFLLPASAVETPTGMTFAACKLEPEGLDPLAGSGEVWMVPKATWRVGRPTDRVQYACAGQPAVVEYDWGKGHVIWWASSTPLENASLGRAQDLDLLVNSLGPSAGHRFYWDESLHGVVRSEWSFAGGPALTLLRLGLPILALLVILSFSRRKGPVRELAEPARTSPIEFLGALGALYNQADAASTALAIAWQRFRRRALHACGLKRQDMSARELAIAILRRFPSVEVSLETDLVACEQAAGNDALSAREAMKLVQLLAAHLDRLESQSQVGNLSHPAPPERSQPHPQTQERAS